jgi:hypothetical protein
MNIRNGHKINPTTSGRAGNGSGRPGPPSSRRRAWLPFLGIGAAFLFLRGLGGGKQTPTRVYSYSSFLSQVQGNHIKTA